MIVPQVVVLTITPEARTPWNAALTAGLVVNLSLLASGMYLYLHHRLTGSQCTGWLAVGMTVAGGFWLTVTGLDLIADRPSQAVVEGIAFVVLTALCVLVALSERLSVRVDPAALGLGLAVVASAAVIALERWTGSLDVPPVDAALVIVLLLLVALVLVVEIHRLETLPPWARDRFATAVAALAVGRACVVADGADGAIFRTVAVVAVVAGSVAAILFLSTSVATLRLAINDDRMAISTLQEEVASTAARSRADRELMHEVKGTIAGIASASHLIHQDPIPAQNRELLEEMLERESARLQRMVQGGQGEQSRSATVLDLDEVLRPLVVAHRAQGQQIAWLPTGLRVRAREDDLTLVVNVLLDNAAHHAPGAAVSITTSKLADRIRVVVADTGPGVPEEHRSAIFDRGARGSTSSGDGLGLYVARELVGRSGGHLDLRPSAQQGADFVVDLPAAGDTEEESDDDAHQLLAQ